MPPQWNPDRQPDILAILTKGTVLNRPELLKAIAPHWSRSSTRPYVIANGEPLLPSGAGWGTSIQPCSAVDLPLCACTIFS